MQVLLSVLGIVLFICLIVIHELGHFMAARRGGVTVREFGLGFPPRAWAKKLKSGLVLSLNWLPIGGFVRLKGEHDYDPRPHSYGSAPLKTKIKIMLAGVFANLAVGLILLTILALFGMPKIISQPWSGTDQFTVKSDTKISRQEVRVGAIQAGSPATAAGLKNRDIIKTITWNTILQPSWAAPQKITSADRLHQVTKMLAGKSVSIEYSHDGRDITKSVTLRTEKEVNASLKTDNPLGYLGVEPVDLQIQKSTWSAPIVAAGFTGQLTWLTLQGIGHALGGLGSTIAGLATHNHSARENGQTQATAQVGGPVAIANILWGSGSLGVNFMLMIIAVISLTLAIMNILPIPALDGGRLAVTLFYRLICRTLRPNTEDWIHGAGMATLLVLFLLITVVDVKRYF